MISYFVSLFVSSIVLIVLPYAASPQEKRIVSGTIYDKQSKEVLIGASVLNPSSGIGTSSNQFGQFSLWLSSHTDTVELLVSFMGYNDKVIRLALGNPAADVFLERSQYSIEGVNVAASNSRNALNPLMSSFRLNPRELESLPSFAGEKDLLLYLQLSPSVSIAGDGNANLYVRGGSHDQNLFLLDNMPLYHVSHLGGFTSTFNSDIIKAAEIHTGAFPARFGGRLSSVVDIHTKDGDMQNHNQKITLGMLTSKVTIDGPIVPSSSSYLVSLRKNTIPFLQWIWDVDQRYDMYDANVKLNTRVSSKDRLYFSFYSGSDWLRLNVKDDVEINSMLSTQWGNLASSLRYNRMLTQRLYLNLIIGTTKYSYKERSEIDLFGESPLSIDSRFESSIRDDFFKANLNFHLAQGVKVIVGTDIFSHRYRPGRNKFSKSGSGIETYLQTTGYDDLNTMNPGAYCELIMDDIWGFAFNAGVRVNPITTPSISNNYFEPRVVLSRQITATTAIKGSYAHMVQHFHLVSNTSAGLPTDYRIPAMGIAPPSQSKQLSLGFAYTAKDGMFEIEVESFTKELSNLAELKEGVTYTLSLHNWERILATNGKGASKGIEMLFRKVQGSSTGWISATISNSVRQFDEINNGEVYPFKYDRLISISLFYQQQLSKKVNFSLAWVYGSGAPYSLPQSQYYDQDDNVVFIYDGVNKFRDRPFHRADIGLSYERSLERWDSTWSFSIVNLYNRKNPYFFYTQSYAGSVTLYRFSLFPIMPSISYTAKF